MNRLGNPLETKNHTNSKKYDVIILGAGISGLSAAYTLKKKKPELKIAILEARDRTGGRIFSFNLGYRLVGEYGAEWIGRTHKNIRGFCKDLGIKLEKHEFNEYPFLQKRKHIPDPTLLSALQKMETILHRWRTIRGKNFQALDHISLRKFIAADCTKAEIKILNELYAGEYGKDIRYVSAVRAVADHLTGGKNSHMDFHIRGGNTKLISALAKYIGLNKIFLNKKVEKIIQNKRDVTVTCHDGSIWSAKKIICTLPITSINKTHFKPSMSSEMRTTGRQLKYGEIIKIFLVFPKRFWGAEDYSQLSAGVTQYVFHATQGQPGPAGALCIYATGRRAEQLARMSMKQIWNTLKNNLPSYIETSGIQPLAMFRHSWVHDPFVKGAYAVYHPDEWSEVQKYYGRPYNHIHFAGEHLASMQGFMEGAATTGINSAKNIIKELKHHNK